MSSEQKLATLRQLPNVIGYDKQLQQRIKNGETVEEEVIVVFVSQKIPLAHLTAEQMIPKEIDGIPVDVIDLEGEVKPAIFEAGTAVATDAVASTIGNRNRVRPIVPGISLGNINITAGTYGGLFDYRGDIVGASNAHVGHDCPAIKDAPKSSIILQPGSLDGGRRDRDTVGMYRWHDQIVPETPLFTSEPPCNWWCRFKRRFTGYTPTPPLAPTVPTPMNKQDFFVFDLDDNIEKVWGKTFDFEILDQDRYVGLIFAGTPLVSLVTKMQYQLQKGYYPLNVKTAHIERYDKLFKSGRTTGFTGELPDSPVHTLSSSVVMKVNYGAFYGWFDDVAMINLLSAGGDSGSPVYKRVE